MIAAAAAIFDDIIGGFDNTQPGKTIPFLGDDNIGRTAFITNYCNYKSHYLAYECYKNHEREWKEYRFMKLGEEKNFTIQLFQIPASIAADSNRHEQCIKFDFVVFCFAIDDLISHCNVLDV